MTSWAYLTAPIRTHPAKQVLDASASRARECVHIAPGTKPKLAEVASGIHDVEPTVMVYQSAVRDRHLLITSGQLYIEGPLSGAPQAERLGKVAERASSRPRSSGCVGRDRHAERSVASDGGWLVARQCDLSFCQLAQLTCPFWGCPPGAIGLVRLQRFPHLDHDEVPPIVEITDYVGRKKPRAGPGLGQDRADARLGIGRGIGAELEAEHGSDGHGHDGSGP